MKSPLTGQDDAGLLHVLSPADIAERWKQSLGNEVGPDFRAIPAIEYWRCKNTGLAWYTPLEAAGGGELYAQLERLDWYYMADKWEFRAALRALPPGARVLEVGVGSGHFLQAASERGLSVSGVELNPSAAARVRARRFEVIETDLHDLATRLEQPFDAVCAFQVLEHVPDPRGLLEGMLAVLRPGGRLMLSVPNAAVMRVIDPGRRNMFDMPPHHVSHWDEDVSRALEPLLPVRLVAVHREPLAPYHVGWFVSAYAGVLRQRWGRALGRLALNRWTLRSARWALALGGHYLVPGHTLLVVLELNT